jgi:hypothetical protein
LWRCAHAEPVEEGAGGGVAGVDPGHNASSAELPERQIEQRAHRLRRVPEPSVSRGEDVADLERVVLLRAERQQHVAE